MKVHVRHKFEAGMSALVIKMDREITAKLVAVHLGRASSLGTAYFWINEFTHGHTSTRGEAHIDAHFRWPLRTLWKKPMALSHRTVA